MSGNTAAANGTDVGGFVVLNTGSSNSVEFFVGLSSISVAQARENIFGTEWNIPLYCLALTFIVAEINGRSFDAIKTETQVRQRVIVTLL